MKKLTFLIAVSLLFGCGGGGGGSSSGTLPAGGAPITEVSNATSVNATGATLNGNVTANGFLTDAWIDYSPDPNLTNYVSTTKKSIGSGVTAVPVTFTVTGLVQNTKYYFRVCATNTNGKSSSSITSFSTVYSPLSADIDRTKSAWYISRSTSSIDGKKTTKMFASSAGGANFEIYCVSDGTRGYAISTDFVTGSGLVRFRIGHNPVVTQTWTESPSSGFRYLYPTSFDLTILQDMYQNWNFALELDKFGSGIIDASMDISGFSAAIDNTRVDCGWSNEMFPPNNGWFNVYPDVPPVDAKEATYVPGSTQQFGLIGWRATNPNSKIQLMVRLGENKSLCAGSFLITDHLLYVEQDGRRVSAVSGTDFTLSCGSNLPATFALQGDFDPARPFTLKAYPFHFDTLNPGVPISSLTFD